MAYQPKSYRKFIATAATATLVATAVAPAAAAENFTDVSDRYADAVNFLVDNDVTQGVAEGQFGTQQSIKRVDAAIMVAGLLGLDTENAPDAGFTDVPARGQGAVNALVAAEILSGKTGTSFGADDNMTRSEMAKVIANAYDLVAENPEDLPFTDVSDTFKDFVAALYEAEVANGVSDTQFDANGEVTRGEFALFVYRAETTVPEVAEIASFEASGAYKLTVEFNKAVDVDEDSFSVKRGNSTQSVKEVTVNESGKLVVIELNSKLVDAEYTVVVSGVEEEDLTTTVEVADETVADIEILSDKAVWATDVNSNAIAKVGYQVLNQYGENITAQEDGSITATSAVEAIAGDQSITLELQGEGFEVGDTLPLTVVHNTTGINASGTVEISDAAQVDELEVLGLYNEDDKTLTADTNLSTNEFFLLLGATDQYGNAVTSEDTLEDALAVTVGGDAVDFVSDDDVVTVTTVEVDGEDVLALQLTGVVDANGDAGTDFARAGKAPVTLVSKATGAIAQFDIEVGPGLQVDEFTFGSIDNTISAGQTGVRIPVTALDRNGEELTEVVSEEGLLEGTDGVTISGLPASVENSAKFVEEDGVVYYEFTAPNQSIFYLTAVTNTGNSDSVRINVEAAAEANSLVGLDEDVSTVLFTGETEEIALSDLHFEDQYGRAIDSIGEYTVEVRTDDIEIAGFVTPDGTVDGTDEVVVEDSETLSAAETTINVLAGSKGSAELVFKLMDGDTEVSSYSADFRSVERTEFESYEVAEVADVFGDEDYSRNVTVYGITADGSKVELPISEYNVAVSSSLVKVTSVDAWTLTPQKAVENDTAVPFFVTIGDTGEEFEGTLTVSSVAPSAGSVSFLDTEGDAEDATFSTTDSSVSLDNLLERIVVKDQYGNAATLSSELIDATFGVAEYDGGSNKQSPRVTFSNIVEEDEAGDIEVDDNGTGSANITALEAGDTFTLTVRYGSATGQIKVVIAE